MLFTQPQKASFVYFFIRVELRLVELRLVELRLLSRIAPQYLLDGGDCLCFCKSLHVVGRSFSETLARVLEFEQFWPVTSSAPSSSSSYSSCCCCCYCCCCSSSFRRIWKHFHPFEGCHVRRELFEAELRVSKLDGELPTEVLWQLRSKHALGMLAEYLTDHPALGEHCRYRIG
jgi:hypothetical protein